MPAADGSGGRPERRRPPPPTVLLVLATMTGPLALNIAVPSMPAMARAFDSDFATVQLTLTLYLAGVAVGQLLYGPLSDRYGRRPALLAGLILHVVASLMALAAPTVGLLVLARVAQALGGCAGMVLTRAIVRDVYERDRAASALAYITMAMAVAPAVAPAIGGQLELWFDWRASFVLVGTFGLLVLALCLARLSETNPYRGQRINLLALAWSYAGLVRSRPFLAYALCTAFSAGAFFSFLGGAPYVVVELIGATPRDYGIWFIIISIGYIAGNFTAGRLSVRIGVDGMIGLGVSISLAGSALLLGLALAGALSLMSLFGPMCVIAVGNGISQPNGIVGAVNVNPRIAGAASGLLGFMQMATGGLLSLLVAHLLADSQLPLVTVMAGSTALSVVAFLLVARRRAGDA